MKSQIRILIERAQPGSSGVIRTHVARGECMRDLIEEQFHVSHPKQWQAKHARWVLERGLSNISPATKYHYYRTMRVIVAALGKWPDWEPHLRGSWQTPTGAALQKDIGGRPPRLAHRAK